MPGIRLFSRFCLLLFVAFVSIARLHAGIVEMPNVEESTDLHGRSIYENYNIPSVSGRFLDPEEGPRLWVKEIRLQGVDDFPELGIRTEEVMAFIERLRYEVMREDEIREYGYSDKELAEIADLLNKLDEDNNYEHVTTPDLQRFIWLVRAQKERRGLTVGQIEGIAARVKEYYRSRGLKLAEAYVPRQFMRDGVVNITVVSARLGVVEVKDNQLYDTDVIARVFDDILTKPITFDRISERTYLINDFPGLAITGQFEPGYQVGDSRLILTVNDEQRYETIVRLDNHGSELTGKIRGFVQFDMNNPLGVADRLRLSVLQATAPDNSTYGALTYQIPLFNPRLILGINFSTNQFVLDQTGATGSSIDQLGISGDTRQTDISFEYAFTRSRDNNWWGRLSFDSTESTLDSDEFGNLGLDDETENIRLIGRFDLLNSQDKVLHLGHFGATSGNSMYARSLGLDDTYSKFNADYTRMSFATIPWTEISTRLILKSHLQFSSDSLPATEQRPLASPTTVRAYPVNQFSGDSAFYVGVEWVFNTPQWLTFDGFKKRNIVQKMQPFLFANWATGKRNALGNTLDVDATLADAGLGLQFGYGRSFTGNLQVAFPVSEDFSDPNITVPDDDYRIVVDGQYRF